MSKTKEQEVFKALPKDFTIETVAFNNVSKKYINQLTDEISADGTRYLHLGFGVNVILGATVSAYIATEIARAFMGGISAAFIVKKFLERTAP